MNISEMIQDTMMESSYVVTGTQQEFERLKSPQERVSLNMSEDVSEEVMKILNRVSLNHEAMIKIMNMYGIASFKITFHNDDTRTEVTDIPNQERSWVDKKSVSTVIDSKLSQIRRGDNANVPYNKVWSDVEIDINLAFIDQTNLDDFADDLNFEIASLLREAGNNHLFPIFNFRDMSNIALSGNIFVTFFTFSWILFNLPALQKGIDSFMQGQIGNSVIFFMTLAINAMIYRASEKFVYQVHYDSGDDGQTLPSRGSTIAPLTFQIDRVIAGNIMTLLVEFRKKERLVGIIQ